MRADHGYVPHRAGLALRGRTAGPRRPPAARGGGGRIRPPSVPRPPRGSGVRRLYERARRAWDRPLTAYYVILGASLLITVLGLVMVYSASMIKALELSLPASYFFRKQFLAAVIGTGLLLFASRVPARLHRALAYPLLVGTVFLMVLVQIPGIGHSVNGNQNWIYLGGPFQLQPSEFGKLALILWGADLLARKQDRRLLTQWKHLLVPLVPVAFLLLGLIMLGGDMGTAIILTAILFGLLWLAGAPTRLFVGVLAVAAAIGVLLIRTSPNRMARLACIGATEPGPGDRCWQAVHGIYALASGGWFGSGLGASVEKWGQLPEPHTDFIFAITGEELGLAGTLSVLALFAALGYAGIRVAGRTEDPFVRYAAGGVTTWITAQAVVNIGAVLGLLPIAGVPLPLFSYGGSALLPTMFAIGLLIAFAREEPAARAALAMRPGFGKRAGVSWKSMRRRVKKRPSGER
ncbi:putative lipid II flippase FtsW [Streptomyces sp. NPDC050856]|uniref:putative lipid II flippase FtsW n=1 Tax=Streptomyces sp. NPDC050856 TaxID=3154939 RepID=UPI0033DD38B0